MKVHKSVQVRVGVSIRVKIAISPQTNVKQNYVIISRRLRNKYAEVDCLQKFKKLWLHFPLIFIRCSCKSISSENEILFMLIVFLKKKTE